MQSLTVFLKEIFLVSSLLLLLLVLEELLVHTHSVDLSFFHLFLLVSVVESVLTELLEKSVPKIVSMFRPLWKCCH